MHVFAIFELLLYLATWVFDLQAPCSQSFSGSGSRSGSSFKMNNFWTISHFLFKKTLFGYTLTW